MTILITPDSFKGTYTAAQVAAHIAQGVRAGGQKAVEQPVADGGEGTYEILRQTMDATPISVDTFGPWHDPVRAIYAMTRDGTAVIELASASGLTLPAPRGRDPLTADTYGTGRLLTHAVEHGARHIVLAAGGSATTDGGAGAIAAIEEHGGLRDAQVTILSDVTTPFENAAVVFGPQKGADSDQVRTLTARLHAQAAAYPRDPRGVPRTGAAGGFSGGMWAWYGAQLVSGADFVLDAVSFDKKASDAAAIVVGEGRLDSQTGEGKVISAILARSVDIPVYAVVGSIDAQLGKYAENFAGIFVASEAEMMTEAGEFIANQINV
ncbi:glycerate kinase [Nesterenkonia sandarakina]|uniref:Glycerate kinase n=1 Tax=Nesterenkonia sandarakina TaxID=272918 RepID=A0A2T0YAP0_9MICC|nr:glycerate kinase [Nesterenkonia sandarakina]PRZ11753.1 glycerate kinase [Nesterenkonia sandarakina]